MLLARLGWARKYQIPAQTSWSDPSTILTRPLSGLVFRNKCRYPPQMGRVSKEYFEDEGEFGGRSDDKEEEILREREYEGRNPFYGAAPIAIHELAH